MHHYLKPLDSESGEIKTIEISNFFTLGSDQSCHYQLNEPGIDSRHLRFEFRENQIFIKDLRSTTGTYVNDQLVQEKNLVDGDVIKLGVFEFVYSTSKTNESFPLVSKNEIWNQELQSLSHGAKTDFPILILGSSGTGKDILAQAIHQTSSRNQGPLVCVNCSALTETLIESELFGHVKGSFTGAIQDRKGAFESARGGTLFLDEIGDLPYSLQAKLLRALENNEIRPVGSDRTINTDVRVIAATHQNLTSRIQEGSFRFDLYYRLNVIQITPPNLTHRMEDFDSLFGEFCRQYRVRFNFLAIAYLKKYDWPGNIRELKNLIARASALYPKQQITEDIVMRLLDKVSKNISLPHDNSQNSTLPVIKEIEKQMIIKRLTANKGNQKLTANDLGMPKSTLHDRLKYYDIDVKQFKIS